MRAGVVLQRVRAPYYLEMGSRAQDLAPVYAVRQITSGRWVMSAPAPDLYRAPFTGILTTDFLFAVVPNISRELPFERRHYEERKRVEDQARTAATNR